MKRYIDQAQREYKGTPDATAFIIDQYGERIALVRMSRTNGAQYALAWIGAELAESPDEIELDEMDWRPRWRKLK